MLARDLFGQCKNSRLFYDVNVACLMAMLDNSSEILMNAYVYTSYGFFRGGAECVNFCCQLVSGFVCWELALFNLKRRELMKKKIIRHFPLKNIIQFKYISNKEGSRDRIDV